MTANNSCVDSPEAAAFARPTEVGPDLGSEGLGPRWPPGRSILVRSLLAPMRSNGFLDF